MLITQVQPNDSIDAADDLSDAQLDALPFGVIQLDVAGTILKLNATESRLAPYDRSRTIGRNFFEAVAPYTRVRGFYGRFVEGVERRRLHVVFPFRYRLDDGQPSGILVTLFYSKKTDTVWMQIRRP